jgi:uncharacterized glyoxalase superfamily protein PhnB
LRANPAYEIKGLAAVLYVKDLAAALAYYRDRLGFTVRFTWGEPPYYACLNLGDADLHLNTYAPVGKSIVYIFCTGVDALHADLAARGANVTQLPATEAYGMREFSVMDPDGHTLAFGEPWKSD